MASSDIPIPVQIRPNQPVELSNLILSLTEEAERAVTERWQQRIIARIADQVESELREGLPLAAPDSEKAALGIIKGVAGDLRAASQALFVAAEQLKRAGRAFQASQAHQAGRQAAEAAEGLIGA